MRYEQPRSMSERGCGVWARLGGGFRSSALADEGGHAPAVTGSLRSGAQALRKYAGQVQMGFKLCMQAQNRGAWRQIQQLHRATCSEIVFIGTIAISMTISNVAILPMALGS
eukprot:1754205-Pleurochrysis_carterae.AAC.2